MVMFEQSRKPERRVTQAIVRALEQEFSAFLRNPPSALAQSRGRSREVANRFAGKDGFSFPLLPGMPPGIYALHVFSCSIAR